jgi:hypothetical protein
VFYNGLAVRDMAPVTSLAELGFYCLGESGDSIFIGMALKLHS